MFKLLKKMDKKGVSPVVATVLLIALTVAAGAVIWVVVRNYLQNSQSVATLSVTIDANRQIQTDSDGHHNIMDLRITITVDGAESVIVDNIYLKRTTDGATWAAAYHASLNGHAYWTGNYRDDTFYNYNSESFKTVAGTKTYHLDFAYSGNDFTTFDHTGTNLAGTTQYNWQLYITFHMPGEAQQTTQVYATITTPF